MALDSGSERRFRLPLPRSTTVAGRSVREEPSAISCASTATRPTMPWCLQRGDDDLFDLGVGHGARCARSWLIEQPIDPFPGEASAPLADGRWRQTQASGNRLVVLFRHATKYDTRSTRELRGGARPPRHRLKVLLLSFGQNDWQPLGVLFAYHLLERRG